MLVVLMFNTMAMVTQGTKDSSLRSQLVVKSQFLAETINQENDSMLVHGHEMKIVVEDLKIENKMIAVPMDQVVPKSESHQTRALSALNLNKYHVKVTMNSLPDRSVMTTFRNWKGSFM